MGDTAGSLNSTAQSLPLGRPDGSGQSPRSMPRPTGSRPARPPCQPVRGRRPHRLSGDFVGRGRRCTRPSPRCWVPPRHPGDPGRPARRSGLSARRPGRDVAEAAAAAIRAQPRTCWPGCWTRGWRRCGPMAAIPGGHGGGAEGRSSSPAGQSVARGQRRHPVTIICSPRWRAAFTEDGAVLFVSAGIDPTRPLPAQGDSFWWGARSGGSCPSPISLPQGNPRL